MVMKTKRRSGEDKKTPLSGYGDLKWGLKKDSGRGLETKAGKPLRNGRPSAVEPILTSWGLQELWTRKREAEYLKFRTERGEGEMSSANRQINVTKLLKFGL